jgi:hypothetical protein
MDFLGTINFVIQKVNFIHMITLFCCLVISRLVISFCNKIQYNKHINFLYLYSSRIYDNLILGIHMMGIWF